MMLLQADCTPLLPVSQKTQWIGGNFDWLWSNSNSWKIHNGEMNHHEMRPKNMKIFSGWKLRSNKEIWPEQNFTDCYKKLYSHIQYEQRPLHGYFYISNLFLKVFKDPL